MANTKRGQAVESFDNMMKEGVRKRRAKTKRGQAVESFDKMMKEGVRKRRKGQTLSEYTKGLKKKKKKPSLDELSLGRTSVSDMAKRARRGVMSSGGTRAKKKKGGMSIDDKLRWGVYKRKSGKS